MKEFIYAGKYNGNPDTLPRREHPEGAVQFKEPEMNRFVLIANIGAAVVTVVLLALVILRGHAYLLRSPISLIAACFAPLLTMLPHELLHGVCFRGNVYMYTNLRKGMLFVIGTEDMSRSRFVFLSLLPNIVFGFIPTLLGLIFPKLVLLGVFGALCTGMGFGDFINVYNALTQVPENALTYLSGFHSYWYIKS